MQQYVPIHIHNVEPSRVIMNMKLSSHGFLFHRNIQWGKKVFSQPPIVQVLPLKKMREACNFHHR